MSAPFLSEAAAVSDGALDEVVVPVEERLARARRAAADWGRWPIGRRLDVIRRLRHRIAASGDHLAELAGRGRRRPPAESLAAEVIPLADACRFLERRAERLLAPRRLGRDGRPAWLSGSHLEVHREPLGVVLVIAPSNYPLLLPGVQALQALAAGNTVLLKPGTGGAPIAAALIRLAAAAGLPEGALDVLPEAPEAARAAIAGGVDHIVLTGSAATGRAVLADAAQRLTPATVELSGCDAAFVRRDADLDLAARAIAFGLTLNASATCIAPRRVFAHRSVADELERRLAAALADAPAVDLDPATRARLRRLVDDAEARGGRLVCGEPALDARTPPIVIADAHADMELMAADIFAPVTAICRVDGDDEALDAADRCPYALGATVFGSTDAAHALALRVRAGVVVVNDMIAPTADARLPFGGRGASGFGVTRGAEGLLELTAIKAVVVRRGRFRPHFDPAADSQRRLLAAYLEVAHGGGRSRLAALGRLLRAMIETVRGRATPPSGPTSPPGR